MRLLLLVCLLMTSCQGARILAVLPHFAKSHQLIFRGVLDTLAARGHEITCYTSMKLSPPANYTEIVVNNTLTMAALDAITTMEMFNWFRKAQVAATTMIWAKEIDIVSDTLATAQMKDLLNSKDHYDLVIAEPHFAQESLLGFGHRFRAPVVSIHTAGAFSLSHKVTGNSLSMASVPDPPLPFSNKMTFFERAVNVFSILTTLSLYYLVHLPRQEKLAREFFKDPSMPSVVDMVHNISLVVTNTHPYVHYAQPNTPNIVNVGGLHISTVKPLPQNIQSFMDQASDGVIYFSFGSVVPDHILPQKFYENFINVFRRLPQRVLWKTRFPAKDLPENVMALQWAPQLDILNHPNTVLFMTHGGLLSQHEAIYSGVPVVCIPVFSDQHGNGRFYDEKEIGVRILFDDLSEETIEAGIKTALSNKKYQENMRQLSLVYRDRPVSASDSLVFWVEYVLRHKGAAHLRPVSSTMPWYQLALFDVIAVLLTVGSILVILVYIITVKIFKTLLRQKHIDKNSKKNK